MASRHHRLIALVLAADLLALAGCAQPPAGTFAAVPTRAEAQAPAARALAPVAAPVVTETFERIESEDAAPVALTKPAELFAADYAGQRYQATDLVGDEAETAAEVQAQISTPGSGLSLGKIGGAIGAGLVGTGLLGYFVYAGMVGSKDLMYPTKTTFKKDPGEYGVPFEAVSFHSHDGLRLKGWYVPAAVPTDKGLVVFHGHSSNKDTMYKKYGTWLRQKYNVFLYDSRYHGESEGKFTTLGYYERADALIALDQLRARGNTRVGVLGESMGGAVAMLAAAVDKDVKAVWSDCAFDSLQDAIAPRAAARKYPMPSAVGFAVVKTVSIRAKARVDQIEPIKFVDKIAPRPLYIVHGKKDDDTTPINADKLFEKAKEPKQLWLTEGADHAESVDKYPEEYQRRTLEFFDAAL